jgi:transposase InsO family protein
MERSLAIEHNSHRNSYAPWFKECLVSMLEKGMGYSELSILTSIPVKTLENFKQTVRNFPQKTLLDSTAKLLGDIWTNAPSYAKKNLETFWSYLGRKHSTLKVSHEQVRQALIDLGLRYPRGPKIKNEGAEVKIPFSPHALWEGDGKQITITINGEIFNFCWYAFIDQNTTLLVGSSITENESVESFLQSLKDGKSNVDFYAMGILIDNRLPDSDLGPVKEFCEEHGITIVRTFPGNSKSNGNIESNFSIFEKFVGQVNVVGKTPKDLANSFGKAIIEIFTQQRNHSPRERNGGKTPNEASSESVRPEELKGELERLRGRFEQENVDIEQRWSLIEHILPYWGNLSNASIEKIKKDLLKYSMFEIIAASASFIGQAKKHPENNYGPGYFMAILRNKREEAAKRAYNETFRAGVEIWNSFSLPKTSLPTSEIIECLHDYIIETFNLPTPAEKLLCLESLSWWMVEYSSRFSLPQLWTGLQSHMERSIKVSLKTWSKVAEFLGDKLFHLLWPIGKGYKEPTLGKAVLQ